MRKNVNWWTIIAVLVIGIPVGYAGMALFKKLSNKTGPDPMPNPETLFLNVGDNHFDIKSEGDEVSFEIYSNTDWTITVDNGSDWLSVAPTEGIDSCTASLTAVANTDTDERSASVKVVWTDSVGTEKMVTIDVKQEGKTKVPPDSVKPTPPTPPTPQPTPTPPNPPTPPTPPTPIETFVRPAKSEISFTKDGGSKNLSVSSNTSWTVAATGGDGWLTVGSTRGKGNMAVTLKATKNTGTSERNAKVTFTWKDGNGVSQSSSVNVSQAASMPTYTLSVSPKSLSFDGNGGERTVTVKSNTDWSVATSGGWVTVSTNGGNGDKAVSVKAEKNTTDKKRTANVTFKWTDGKGTPQSSIVSISQEAVKKLFVKPAKRDMTFTSIGGSQTLSVSSNTSWTLATTGGDWLTATKVGNGISVKADKNTSTSKRSAKIQLSWKDENGAQQTDEVSVYQAMPAPMPITKEEIQQIVRSGNANSRIPDDCDVTNNGVVTHYGKFRNEVKGGKFDAVTVITFTPDKLTGNAKSIVVKTTVPVEKLTEDEARKILSSGQKSAKVPDGCTIIVNGEQMKYSFFRRAVYLGTFSNISVKDVICDSKGNGSKITVSATETKGEE